MLYYLATPFTLYPAGEKAAFREAARITGRLIERGIFVYSPIVHCCPASEHGECELGYGGWLEFDLEMIKRCDHLLVARMEGWEKSKGVAFEIEEFRKKAWGTIYDLDPITLEMEQRGG